MASAKLKALREQRGVLYNKMQALTDKADAEKRDFNTDENKDFEGMEAEFNGIKARIERQEKLDGMEEESRQLASDVEVEPAGEVEKETRGGAATSGEQKSKGPWKTFGEQLRAVAAAATPGMPVDKRLIDVRSITGMGETNPSDGGFLVQTDFTAGLLKRTYERGILASRVRRIPLGADKTGTKINAIDETSRATGSRLGGITTYWVGEGGTVTPSKPKLRQISLQVHKLMGLCYATDEMLADAPLLQSVIEEGFIEEFSFVLDDVIFRGTGVGQPRGFHGHPCEVSVAKESSQSGAGVIKENIVNMRSRLWVRSRSNAVWLINQDVEPQLHLLTLGDLGCYFPAGSFANQPLDQLFGRPVIPVEHCETMGTKGDIKLVDLNEYVMIDKGSPEAASSVHVRFLYDEQVFRFTYRVDGQPIWNTTLTPYKGSNTVSPFVTLATRP